MPLARIGTTLIYYAHIPKTGGSSVEAYLASKGHLALKFPRRLGWSKSTAQHMHAKIHRALVPDGFIDCSFTVLRDPVRRLISEYRYRSDRHRKSHDIGGWVTRMLRKYENDAYAQDNHIRPQADFVRPGMKLFLLEDGLDVVFDWIDEKSNTPPKARDVWEKKSTSAQVVLPDDVRTKVEAFYAKDYALIEKAKRDGYF